MQITIHSNLDEFSQLGAHTAEFIANNDLPRETAYILRLVLDEIVSNVIRHAYGDEDDHEIDISLAVDGDQVVVTVWDDGAEFDPTVRRALPRADSLESVEPGGRGIFLVQEFVDDLSYAREGDRNRCQVRFHLQPRSD